VLVAFFSGLDSLIAGNNDCLEFPFVVFSPEDTVMSISLRRRFSLALRSLRGWPLALMFVFLLGGFSGQAQAASIALIQHTGKDAGTTSSSALAFVSPNTAGNWIAVCIRAGRSGQVFTVTDSKGNTYRKAVQFDVTLDPPNGDTLGIFYAENIAGGPNTITVSDTALGTLRFEILEYSGVAAANSLDQTLAAQGNSLTPNSGSVTTTSSGDLLLGAILTGNSTSFTAGSGYTIEESVPAPPNAKLIAEDQIQLAAGAAAASASLAAVGNWGAGLAAFKAAGGAGGTATVTATAGTPQSTTISTAFGTSLQATVKDSLNNPMSGVVVTFNAPASGATGTFAGGVNTATTDALGVATANVFTANGTAGSYTVAASATGASPANFSLTNLAGTPASVTATAGTPQSAIINTAFATRHQATVKDAGSNPVGGVVVTFAAPASGATGIFAGGVNTATTDALGVATANILTANGTAGSYTVSASVTGVSTSANFSLNNLPPSTGGIKLVQHIGKDGGVTTSSSLAFNSSNTAGNWIAVCIRAGGSNGQVFTIGDSNKNVYRQAAQFNITVDTDTIAIFYAENIAGGPNTITVSDTFSGTLRFAILEYSGVALANSLDATATAQGASASPSSGNLTTTANGDLLLGAISTANAASFTAGSGFIIEETVPAVPNAKLIAEDQIQIGPGTVSANASLGASDNWSAGLAAFKPASGGGSTAPSITSLSQTAGAIGNPITITGTNFGATQGSSTVTFSGTVATVATWNATSIAVTVPAGATTGNVVVTVGGVPSNGVLFTVTSAPNIAGLNPTSGPVGSPVTVSGANFGPTQGSSTVTFNGTAATVGTWSATSIAVTVPTGATTGNVVVTVGGVPSTGVSFTVTPPPNITSLIPTSGPIGASVTITGTNFGTTVGTIQSFVTFNGTQGRSSSWTDTSITVPVPAGATTGNVVVTVFGVVSNGVAFSVTPPPSIAGLNPTSGPVGTPVTVSGANFGPTQGTSTVTFNGTVAPVTIWSTTSITVPVPAGATPGNVVVTVGGVASNGLNFAVTSTTGNISLVQHTSKNGGTTTSAALAFVSPNTAGNWIAVCIRAGNAGQVFTVSDSKANTYRKAVQMNMTLDPPNGDTLGIFYAENIAGGPNTITVSDTISGTLRFAILEYSGVAAANSLEQIAAAQGNSATPNSGSATTTSSGDLLLGAILTGNPASYTPGSGYTIEESVPAQPNAKLITEDQLQRVAGSASASASLAASDVWGATFAAFRSASGAALPLTVKVSPTTASVPTGYGTQSFTTSLVNDFQNQGVMWSLSGTGCSGATCGSLSNATTMSVTYNSPANVPNPATVTLTATSIADNTKAASATITVTQGAIHVSLSPKRAAVTMSASQTVQFTATVTNDPLNRGVTWMVDGNNGGIATTGTITTTGLYVPGTQPGQHTITAVSAADASATASSTVGVTDLAGVFTHHNDTARTGQNLKEYALTTTSVSASTFGALFSCPVDGHVWAAPLYVANLTIGTQTHNAVFIATSHDSVYAFDADSPSCVQLWNVSFLGTGVTTVLPADVQDNSNDMFPEIGITSTPVVDPATNTIYVEGKTKETVGTVNGQVCSSTSPCYVHRLHAMDLMTGAEKLGGPVVISSSNPNFDPRIHLQRPALLLNNGTVYIAFGSHGDRNSYQGWLMGYDAANLTQKFVTPLTNVAGRRGGVWGAGAGPAADASGNIYVSTGNGTFDGTGNFGDSAVKLSPTGAILDWFTPFNQSVFNANDIDLGSSGVIILPDSVGSAAHPHLALATGKVAILYLLDQTNMGKFNSTNNIDVQEVIPVPPPNTTFLDGGNFGVPAYWNGNIYTAGVNFPLSQFQIVNGALSTPQFAKSNNAFPLRGATPVVSASGATNGIVWILDLTGWPSNGNAILDAYDAADVSKLLFSSPSSGPGAAGPAVKFTVPTVANGKVYVGGQRTVTVFGLSPN
jgi:hypothetical protein